MQHIRTTALFRGKDIAECQARLQALPDDTILLYGVRVAPSTGIPLGKAGIWEENTGQKLL